MKKLTIILLLLCFVLSLIPFELESQWLEYVLTNTLIISIFTFLYITVLKNIKNKDKEEPFSKKEFFIISTLGIYQPFNFYVNNVFEISFLTGLLFIVLSYLYFLIIFFLVNKFLDNKNKSLFVAIIFIFLSLNFYRDINIVNCISLLLLYSVSNVSIEKCKKPIIVFALILLILNSFVFIGNYIKIAKNRIDSNSKRTTSFQSFGNKSNKTRDIYIILLDQYSGTNVLKKKWNFDNSEFINELKKEGFYVFDKMYSNYNTTFASIPSILNLEYFENTQYPTSSSVIEDALLYKIAKYNDYNTFFIKNIYFNLEPTMYLDFVISGSKLSGVLDMLTMFFNQSFWHSIIDSPVFCNFLSRQRVSDEESLLNTKGKKFVFMHMLMPHQPYLYDENGNMLSAHYDLETGYLPYLKYVNKWTLDKIHELKSNTNNMPVIIITGDHGMRDANIFESYFSTFTAYYNPEHEYFHVKNANTLINFFIDFVNYEFNINIPQKEPKIEYLDDPGGQTLTDHTISKYINTAKDVTKQYLK